MEKIATLTGHTYRVLYLAMSPDGSSIVTGAGDETLRFWNIFPKSRSSRGVLGYGRDVVGSGSSKLFPSSNDFRWFNKFSFCILDLNHCIKLISKTMYRRLMHEYKDKKVIEGLRYQAY